MGPVVTEKRILGLALGILEISQCVVLCFALAIHFFSVEMLFSHSLFSLFMLVNRISVERFVMTGSLQLLDAQASKRLRLRPSVRPWFMINVNPLRITTKLPIVPQVTRRDLCSTSGWLI